MKKALKEKFSKERQLDDFVSREVAQCVSGLMEEILSKEIISIDDVENLYQDNEETGESEPQEVLEWWIVSKWFYEKLKEQGEVVVSYDGFNHFWGRTCSGQAISMDSVIEHIWDSIQ